MFGDNRGNSDDSIEFEYAVFHNGEIHDVFLDPDEADEVAEDLAYDYPFGEIAVEALARGYTGYFESEEESDEVVEEEPRGYSFISATQQADQLPEEPTPMSVTKWSLGSHSSKAVDSSNIDALMEGLDGELDADLLGVLQQASRMAGGVHPSGFECPVCGLNHGHSDDKHDIRDAFGVTAAFAEEMDMCPYCHCGVSELAMLIDFYGYITESVFADDEKFSAVRELDNGVLQRIVRKMRDDNLRAEVAIRRLNLIGEVPDTYVVAITEFYRRANNIKRAASSAPISSETEYEIADQRRAIEELIESV